ncbi:MAG: cytochrome b [Myxococcota bacterium]
MRELWKRVRDSVFRVGWPEDDRKALLAMRSSFLLHLHAPKVRPFSLTFAATWALGFVSLVLCGELVLTGFYLMFYYVPHPDAAYRSMKDLAFVVPFGMLTRNLHRWAAHAMVALVTLHMVRVFLSGGYKPPREANWVAGVGLWVLTLALSFTGYLLPWDQLAFWAVTVGSKMVASVPLLGEPTALLLLGDASVGEAALLRFYVLHCVVLPGVLGAILCFHVYRVRRDGGLVTSEHAPGQPTGEGRLVPAWPHLVYRELAVGLFVMALLLAASFAFDAPLEPEADPTRTPNPAKAPWYFLGIQELAHYHAFWGGVFVPGATVAALCLLPYLDRHTGGLGRYWPRERARACAIFVAVGLFFVAVTVVGTFFRGPAWALVWWPP